MLVVVYLPRPKELLAVESHPSAPAGMVRAQTMHLARPGQLSGNQQSAEDQVWELTRLLQKSEAKYQVNAVILRLSHSAYPPANEEEFVTGETAANVSVCTICDSEVLILLLCSLGRMAQTKSRMQKVEATVHNLEYQIYYGDAPKDRVRCLFSHPAMPHIDLFVAGNQRFKRSNPHTTQPSK